LIVPSDAIIISFPERTKKGSKTSVLEPTKIVQVLEPVPNRSFGTALLGTTGC
jgi:hypothetical protein